VVVNKIKGYRGGDMRRLLGLVAVGCMMMACTHKSTSGKEFQEGAAQSIVIGSTTSQEVVQMIGPPYRKDVAIDGKEQWVYQFSEVNDKGGPGLYRLYFPGNQTQSAKSLNISFSNKGIVSDCTLYESAGSASGNYIKRSLESSRGGTSVQTKCGRNVR
jgi:outer membrane protein assembly factor BamE (lipoprotein component of BamABCDE complex)